MGLLRNLKLWISPPQITDPNFGKLTFMHIDKHPERSYWECNWNFPPTSTVVFITLPGGENGPTNEARQFYLGLPARYDFILTLCRQCNKNNRTGRWKIPNAFPVGPFWVLVNVHEC